MGLEKTLVSHTNSLDTAPGIEMEVGIHSQTWDPIPQSLLRVFGCWPSCRILKAGVAVLVAELCCKEHIRPTVFLSPPHDPWNPF